MSCSAPSSGAGSVSSRAERRLRRASMACIGVLSQTRAMLTLSEACERNKGPILEVLRTEFAASRSVLEVGSGTGQHAVHFAAHLPHLTWQPSELDEQLAPLAEDRKSTRLNSSHLVISYAVFCLKKKKPTSHP